MDPTATTLSRLELGAQVIDQKVDEHVARCLATAADPVALRNELRALAEMKSQRAEFAYCLFSLELARQGEAEAKADFARHAGILLDAHRNPDLTGYLLGENPELRRRWDSYVPLLVEFERAQKGKAPLPQVTTEKSPESALDVAIAACFSARGDRNRLHAAIEALSGYPQSPRRELAVCLFELERVRLGADDAKKEFAQRTGVLLEAYRAPERAKELIGQSKELEALWKDLVPYLEEFFEPPEADDYEVVEEVVDAGGALEIATLDDDDGIDVDVTELQLEPAAPPPPKAGPPPPPPPSPTPAPGRLASLTPTGRIRRTSSQSYRRLSIPPPPAPPPSGIQPGPETLAFWAYAEKSLELLPDDNGQLSGKQTFDLTEREQRGKLKRFAAEIVQKFPNSPEARAMGCLVELYLAASQKEKTLFGKPNEKRQLAIQDALSLLTRDPIAAGHAAVLFESDGVKTRDAFGEAIAVVHQFLGFCARNNLDPLQSSAVQRFKG